MRRQRKYNLILFLIILVAGIGLGYAALSANLEIDGTTNLTKTTWDIHFDHIQETSGGVIPNSTTSINAAGDTVTYNITLSTPGDFYEFTVDAVNAGTVDGMIESITSTLNNGSISNLPDCLTYSVTYSDGVEIATNHLLAANSTETYKVRVEFKTDIEEDDLPDSNQTLSFAFSVNYIQADDNGVAPSHVTSVYTINHYDTSKPDNNYVRLNQAMPNTITTYQTLEDAMAAFSDGSFYLKHTISNNVVTESYAVFVVTSEIALANNGMTVGSYYLRGGVDESSVSEQPIYEANKAILLSAFGSSRCTGSSDYFLCSALDLHVYVLSSGGVTADGGDVGCSINPNGYSYLY